MFVARRFAIVQSLRDMMQTNYFVRPELADVYAESFIDWCSRKENNCSATHWSRTFGPGSDERLRATIARAYEVTRVLLLALLKATPGFLPRQNDRCSLTPMRIAGCTALGICG
jgi:hypothetical protein